MSKKMRIGCDLTNNQRTCAGENREVAIICVVWSKVDLRMDISKLLGNIIWQLTLANTTHMIASSLSTSAHVLWLLVSYTSFSSSLILVTIFFPLQFWFFSYLFITQVIIFNFDLPVLRLWRLQHTSLNKSFHTLLIFSVLGVPIGFRRS